MVIQKHMLPAARRAASRVCKSPLLADEAAERALHQLVLVTLAGRPPQNPTAWLCVVAKRTAIALARRGWGTNTPEDFEPEGREAPPWDPDRSRRRHQEADMVREAVAARLSSRQLQGLDAALSHRSLRAAAASCDMRPRDLRRVLGVVTRKAQECIFGTGIASSTRRS
ncbi:MAG: hypothetical protein RL398_3505 [Planctomycetota bacterium]